MRSPTKKQRPLGTSSFYYLLNEALDLKNFQKTDIFL